MTRDLSQAVPVLADFIRTLIQAAADELGIVVFVVGVLRTPQEHKALWMQNRFPLDAVNKARAAAGLSPITDKENGHKVTWTKKSKHLANEHGFSEAVDIGVRDAKGGYERTERPYRQVVTIGKRIIQEKGLPIKAGADFGDLPHWETTI